MCWVDTAAQSFHLDSHGNFNGVVCSCMVKFPNCTVMNSISGGHCKKTKNKKSRNKFFKKNHMQVALDPISALICKVH
jgi:hypothetical protein